MIYSTYLGGSALDVSNDIALDNAGNAYITGYTLSNDFPLQNAYQSSIGWFEAFIVKMSGAGNSLIYSTYLGSVGGDDGGCDISVDGDGNAFVTGWTSSTDFPTANPYQGSHGGGDHDAFITKFASSGTSLVFSTYLGGSQDDEGWDIEIDPDGNSYVAGFTCSRDFPTSNPYQASHAGTGYESDAFLTKLTSTGDALTYSTYLGGQACDYGVGLALCDDGSILVAGHTWSSDFPTQAPFQANLGGSGDAFVSRFGSAGNSLLYSTYLGGSSDETGYDVGTDGSSAYVVGRTNSTDFPTADLIQGHQGDADVYVTKLDNTGSSAVYSTYLGGSGYDVGTRIAVDAYGDAYVTGLTRSSDFPTVDPLQSLGGSADAFVTKLREASASCCIQRGNIDHSDPSMPLNSGDLLWQVDYMFSGGPVPPCPEEGDTDNTGSWPPNPGTGEAAGPEGDVYNSADLLYLVDYMFQGGPDFDPCR